MHWAALIHRKIIVKEGYYALTTRSTSVQTMCSWNLMLVDIFLSSSLPIPNPNMPSENAWKLSPPNIDGFLPAAEAPSMPSFVSFWELPLRRPESQGQHRPGQLGKPPQRWWRRDRRTFAAAPDSSWSTQRLSEILRWFENSHHWTFVIFFDLKMFCSQFQPRRPYTTGPKRKEGCCVCSSYSQDTSGCRCNACYVTLLVILYNLQCETGMFICRALGS